MTTYFFAIFSLILFSNLVDSLRIDEEIISDGNNVLVLKHRELTPEEEALANHARIEIAQAIEKNLIRMFAVIASENERRPYPRQDDYDYDTPVTPNPNVLPQVAQILGAIFSGSLNLTRIADSTVGLVPNLLRNQIQGLVKFLTGENVNLSGTTATPVTPAPKTPAPVFVPDATTETEPIIVEADDAEIPETERPTTERTTESPPTTRIVTKSKYMIRRGSKRPTTTQRTTTPYNPEYVDDEQLFKIERDLVAAGKLFEPYEDRDPRIYAGMFQDILDNVNMTEVAKAVPTIFRGASQAFTLLNNLGLLETLPGSEVLNAIGLEEEEEE